MKVKIQPVNRVNVLTVAVTALEPNPWNPNRQTDFMYAKELQSIRDHGFIDPVTARETAKGKFQIIDGEHRWRAAKELGFKTIPVNSLGTVDDATAKKLTLILNALKGENDPLKLADVVKGLASQVSMEDLYAALPYANVDLDAMIRLSDFDFAPMDRKPLQPGPNGNWVKLEFLVAKDQVDVIEQAIARLMEAMGLEGKAARGRALELMAADSLNTPLESYQ